MSDANINVTIYSHPEWDMTLTLVEEEGFDHMEYIKDLDPGCDLTLLESAETVMTQAEIDDLPEWDG